MSTQKQAETAIRLLNKGWTILPDPISYGSITIIKDGEVYKIMGDGSLEKVKDEV